MALCSVLQRKQTGADLFHFSKHTRNKPNHIAYWVETQKSRENKIKKSQNPSKSTKSLILKRPWLGLKTWRVWRKSEESLHKATDDWRCVKQKNLLQLDASKMTMVQPVFHRENRTNCNGTRNERCQVESTHSTVIWGHVEYIDYLVYIGKVWLFQHFNYTSLYFILHKTLFYVCPCLPLQFFFPSHKATPPVLSTHLLPYSRSIHKINH